MSVIPFSVTDNGILIVACNMQLVQYTGVQLGVLGSDGNWMERLKMKRPVKPNTQINGSLSVIHQQILFRNGEKKVDDKDLLESNVQFYTITMIQ